MTVQPGDARWLVLCLSLAAGCAAPAAPTPATVASTPPAAPRLRSPEAILADSVAAEGGAAAWNAHRTLHLKMTVTLQGMAMSGPTEHFQTRADKSLTVTTLPGVGQTREGSNGKVFWSDDPVNGLRFLRGAEAEEARIESAWNADLEAQSLFKKIETAADSPPDQECLTMTLREGAPIRACYDRQTHLEVSQEGIRATAQGEVPFRSTMSDWRTVGGVKLPYASQTQAGPMTILTTVESVAFDEPIDEAMFEPPAPAAAP
jgi:hypothetical protein